MKIIKEVPMRLILSMFLFFSSQAAFSATDCSGSLSIDSGNQWRQAVSESYEVNADFTITLTNIVLTTKKPGQVIATALYDFCEVTRLGTVSEYECFGFDAVDGSRFPYSISVKDVENQGERAFTFFGESESNEGKVPMTGKVNCAQ